MQYYQILIFIHRPFASRNQQPPNVNQRGRFVCSQRICIQSAIAIAQLLRMYESRYTLRQINIQVVSITFSAALMLLFSTLVPSQSHDSASLHQNLYTCHQALAELGNFFENASRALELLLSIKRGWKARLVASTASGPAPSAWAMVENYFDTFPHDSESGNSIDEPYADTFGSIQFPTDFGPGFRTFGG